MLRVGLRGLAQAPGCLELLVAPWDTRWQKSDKLERSQGSDYPPGVTVHGHQLPNLGEGERMVQPTRHTDFCKNRNTPRHQGANPP